MISLRELVAELPDVISIVDSTDLDGVVADVQLDSRLVDPAAVFVSVVGEPQTQAAHLSQARRAGAVAVIAGPGSDADIIVDDPKAAAAACSFYRHPSRELTAVAVTGTNGKSSITHTLGGVLTTLGASTGVIGTIAITLDGTPLDVQRRTPTTPESVDLQRLLRQFVGAGATHAVMEASSIALAECRLEGTDIDVGCFTNLTRDHLDVHGSLADYEAAKLHLFDLARSPVANLDDPVGHRIRRRWPDTTGFALHSSADLTATDLHADPDGTSFLLHTEKGSFPASVRGYGEISVSNALAVLAATTALDVSLPDAIRALAAESGPPGRMQLLTVDRPYAVMIDYAHSPDALDQVLRTLRASTSGRILTVFGCGGDRDRGKRPIMGRIAAEHSDQVIITSDNPRTEDPDQIIADIVAGTPRSADHVHPIRDRCDAIAHALATAQPGDLVLIAGKGSEEYQIIGHTQVPYTDEATVRALTN